MGEIAINLAIKKAREKLSEVDDLLGVIVQDINFDGNVVSEVSAP